MSYKSQYTGSQIDEAIGKANKVLTTPDTAPDSPRIVSIATDGTQQDLTLGDGLSVADGVISASGGPVYEHYINFYGGGLYGDTDYAKYVNVGFSIFNNSPTPFTDLTSAIDEVIAGDLADTNDTAIPARGVAAILEEELDYYNVTGNVEILFVTLLTASKSDTTISLRFSGMVLIEEPVTMGVGKTAHEITILYPQQITSVDNSSFSAYDFSDTVHRIV